MEIAQKLCDKLYCLIKNQKRCAPQLVELAKELEAQRKAYTVVKYVGNTASVLGSAAVVGAGLVTFFSGGVAAPLLVAATAAAGATVGGAGVVVNLGAQLFEWLQSSSTMKDAEKIIEKIRKLRENIETLQNELKAECEKFVSCESSEKPEAMEYVLRALAERSGVEWHANDTLLSVVTNWPNRRFRIDKFHGGHGSSFHLMVAFPVLGAACLALIPTEVGKTALKSTLAATLKGAAQIGGGVLGVALSLPGMIENIKELVKGDHVTEASQSLRNTAKDMKTVAEDLEKELDSIQEIIKEISEVKRCVSSLDYSDPATKSKSQIQMEIRILEFLKKTSQNVYLLEWIEIMANCSLFLTLLHYLNKLVEKKKKKKKKDEIHIIIVAHGEITNQYLPANLLVPSPSIKDTVLYSPWNCAIDSKVAYGIAKGSIKPTQRDFFCSWCKVPQEDHRPRDLTGKEWNHMKDASFVPEILLRPIKPDEDAWNSLGSLDSELPENRILIPYRLPKGVSPELFPGVSFHIFISALNLALMLCGVKATVHLAAFLCQYSRRDENLFLEYPYVDDYTIMTADMEVDCQSNLYKAFKPMFGESPSCRRGW